MTSDCCNALLRIHPHLYATVRGRWSCDHGSRGLEEMVGGKHGQAHRKDP